VRREYHACEGTPDHNSWKAKDRSQAMQDRQFASSERDQAPWVGPGTAADEAWVTRQRIPEWNSAEVWAQLGPKRRGAPGRRKRCACSGAPVHTSWQAKRQSQTLRDR